MRKIAIFNQKGGVGKTTTAVNLAAGLSRNGKKVVLIDLDPQGSISTWHKLEAKKNLYHIIVENAPIKKCISKLGRNLDVIHCDERLAEAEDYIFGLEGKNSVLEQRFVPDLDYDYAILDCPPSLRLINKNALFYAREVVIPASTDALGYAALTKTAKFVSDFNKEVNQRLMISSVVPTQFDRRGKLSKQIHNQMKKDFTPLLVTSPIRMNTKLREAPKARKSIFTYAKKSPGAQDYWNLVKLLLENEYMYDSKIKAEKREQALREYFVEGKTREMVIMNNKITFSFKYFTQVHDNTVQQQHVKETQGEHA